MDKLSRLNDQIRVLVDRQNRQMQRKNNAEAKAPIAKGKVEKMVNPLTGLPTLMKSESTPVMKKAKAEPV